MEFQICEVNISVEANNVQPGTDSHRLKVRTVVKSAVAAVLLMAVFLRPTIASGVAIVDTLGVATPTTQFSVFGSGGVTIYSEQFVGPQFTLPDSAVLTEIGAFVNNCASIVAGVPQCPNTLPLIVQIRPSIGGIPDPSTVLSSFELSHDNVPLLCSFESVEINLTLGAGSYFALFGTQQASDEGFLMNTASSPFSYLAGSTILGFLDPISGVSSASSQFAAVRVSATTAPVPESSTLLLVTTGILGLLANGWRRRIEPGGRGIKGDQK